MGRDGERGRGRSGKKKRETRETDRAPRLFIQSGVLLVKQAGKNQGFKEEEKKCQKEKGLLGGSFLSRGRILSGELLLNFKNAVVTGQLDRVWKRD